jgi:hypothetical protein
MLCSTLQAINQAVSLSGLMSQVGSRLVAYVAARHNMDMLAAVALVPSASSTMAVMLDEACAARDTPPAASALHHAYHSLNESTSGMRTSASYPNMVLG